MEKGGRAAHVRENIVLYGALLANVGIAVAKFIASALTGSSSMLTEGVHSLVDSGNQLLLLYGQSKAKRPADAAHPFGYGRELYFWAFVVAILIFAVGAGVSVYEGWLHVARPEPLRDPAVNYAVLTIAFLLEGTSWTIAVREFGRSRGPSSWWQSIRRSKDPAGFIVLFEDSAALIGLVVAAIGAFAGAPTVRAFVPGPQPLLEWLLHRRFMVDDFDTFMSSDPDAVPSTLAVVHPGLG